jgi:hypothetical protein
MPNPFLISILTLITTLATTPTIANTNLAVRLVLLWVVCWLVLVLESREMLPLRLLELAKSFNLSLPTLEDITSQIV